MVDYVLGDGTKQVQRPIEDLLFLAERFVYLQTVCLLGVKERCPGTGEIVSPTQEAFHLPYQRRQKARGNCPHCRIFIALSDVTYLVNYHQIRAHGECCQNRMWRLKPIDTWLHYLVRILNEAQMYPVNVGASWIYSDTPASDLATALAQVIRDSE